VAKGAIPPVAVAGVLAGVLAGLVYIERTLIARHD
jgi:hypothetical protein